MTDTPRYTAVAITLHWILAVLLLGMVFFGWYMEDLREGLFAGTVPLEEVQQAYNLHKTTGMAILVLSLIRLAWRLTHKTPGMPEGMKPWEKLAAHAVHWAFYVLMIGMPIMGWISASASELPLLLRRGHGPLVVLVVLGAPLLRLLLVLVPVRGGHRRRHLPRSLELRLQQGAPSLRRDERLLV